MNILSIFATVAPPGYKYKYFANFFQYFESFSLIFGVTIFALGILYLIFTHKLFNISIIAGCALLGYIIGKRLAVFWGISDHVMASVFVFTMLFAFGIFALFVYKIALFVFTAGGLYLFAEMALMKIMDNKYFELIVIAVVFSCVLTMVFMRYTKLLVIVSCAVFGGMCICIGMSTALIYLVGNTHDAQTKIFIVSVIAAIISGVMGAITQYKKISAISDEQFNTFDCEKDFFVFCKKNGGEPK